MRRNALRISALLLTVLLLAGMAVLADREWDGPALKTETVPGDKGDTVEVGITLSEGKGVDSVTLSIAYDPEAIRLIGEPQPGELLSSGICRFYSEEPGRVRMAFACAAGLKEQEGRIATLTFEVLKREGSVIRITEASLTGFGSEGIQEKLYVSEIIDGGICPEGKDLPETELLPWVPVSPTPSPTPEPTPAPTPEPTPVPTPEPAPETTATPEPTMQPAGESDGFPVLPVVIAVLAVLAIVILIAVLLRKKRARRRRRSRRKAAQRKQG